jgi:predicted lipid-binding transport protein (Tim44 family)
MRRAIPFLIAVILALAPALADARPGMGLSLGSRGSHSWSSAPGTAGSPGGAAPFQRSMTPNTYGSGSSYGQSGYGMGMGGFGMGRGGFGAGLMGGLLGAGIGGMLFGHGFFGFRGGSGFLGLLIQLVLLFFIARWIMRRFMGAPAMAGGVGGFARNMFPRPGQPIGGGGAGPRARPVTLNPGDYKMFSQLLAGIQGSWSNHDLNGLQAMATPEMVSYFAEQMAEQTSRGVRNQVLDVRLVQGDLSEAWAEGNREYATVSMRFSMFDVTKDLHGRVVDGSDTERVTVNEFWTFLRSSGGHWVLSAIQQAR